MLCDLWQNRPAGALNHANHLQIPTRKACAPKTVVSRYSTTDCNQPSARLIGLAGEGALCSIRSTYAEDENVNVSLQRRVTEQKRA